MPFSLRFWRTYCDKIWRAYRYVCTRFSEGRRPACVMFIFGLTFLALLALLAEKPLIPSQKFPEFSKMDPAYTLGFIKLEF